MFFDLSSTVSYDMSCVGLKLFQACHTRECALRKDGIERSDGESVEHAWSLLNPVSKVQERSASHRHRHCDDAPQVLRKAKL
ncbi:hypothetical protein B0H14DRAFT_3470684 [Mycena olivaceomarginata]|nr:hypothetical protein B0H14DRAFT_3470684 [Mycena olivaceomarginata]